MDRADQRGFTLTELMFAMAFLGFIMMFIVVVLLQMMSIYNKGVSMSQINQTGRQLLDDIRSQIRFSSPESVIYKSDNRRLCIGDSSYLWNMDNDRLSADTVKNYFSSETGDAKKTTNVGVIRVSDPDSDYCSDLSKMPAANDSGVKILSGRNVSVLEFTVEPPVSDDLISIHVVLSTSGTNKPSNTNGKWQCVDSESDNAFCAFGEFNSLVYMRGGR